MGLDGRVLEVPFVRFYLYLHSKITFANLQNREAWNNRGEAVEDKTAIGFLLREIGTEWRAD